MRISSLTLRSVFFVAFLIGLPVLALPRVASVVDSCLYNDKPTVSDAPLAAAPSQQVAEPLLVEPASPAPFDASLIQAPPQHRAPDMGLDVSSAPPPLNPLPTFLPASAAMPADARQADAPLLARSIDEGAMGRLQQVRQRLEDLGAKYIVLDTTSGTAQYRFHCQMLIDERSTYTRDFNVVAANPLEAAEAVLSQVEAWRLAGRSAGTIRQ
jgi:hypothetical protein